MFWIINLFKSRMNRKRQEQEENLRRAILEEQREEQWTAYFADLGKRMQRDFN